MKTAYTSLEEAHPNEHRPQESQMALALLRAIQRAARQGNLRIYVPEPLRGRVNSGNRHSFGS